MISIFIALAFAGSTPATAAAPIAEPQEEKHGFLKFHKKKRLAKKEDSSRLVCRYQEETGSRLGGRKLCLSQAEWEQKEREDKDATAAIQRNNGMHSN